MRKYEHLRRWTVARNHRTGENAIFITANTKRAKLPDGFSQCGKSFLVQVSGMNDALVDLQDDGYVAVYQ